MRYKLGVRVPADLDSRMFIAIDAIERAWAFVRAAAGPVEIGSEATITSWGDGVHGPNSYHKRQGRAIDVRTKGLPRVLVPQFVLEVQKRIVPIGFDVVLENFNGDQEHVHVEADQRMDIP